MKIFGIGGNKLRSSSVVGLTEMGVENAEQGGDYDIRYRVLSFLKDTPSRQRTIRDIAANLHISESEAVKIVMELNREQKTRTVG